MVSTGWAREQYQSPETLAKVKAAQTIEQLDQAVAFDPQDKPMSEHKIPGYGVHACSCMRQCCTCPHVQRAAMHLGT